MVSQLISNAVRSFSLAMVLAALLTGSVAEAASYQQRQGTIVDPILDNFWNTHSYSGPNLEPGANLYDADLSYANLFYADLRDANLPGANLHDADLSYANLRNANLTGDADLSYAYLDHADLTFANLAGANLDGANLAGADLRNADLSYANLAYTNLASADLYDADLRYVHLRHADLRYAHLTGVDLYGANLTKAYNVETSFGSPYYYGNTLLPLGFNPVAQGWTWTPYCDFTPDAACDLADFNQMFQAGNLVTGVTASVSTDRLDLVNKDIIDAADITEWLAQAATANGYGSPYLRGDTELDRDVDITDFNALFSHFDPTGDGDSLNGPLWNEGNFDGDDDTDITDFNLLAANFSPAGYATSTIPEPSTMLLASLALILVGVSFRLSKNG